MTPEAVEPIAEQLSEEAVEPAPEPPLAQAARELAAQEGKPEADDIFFAFLDWMETQGLTPWPHQEEAILDLMAGKHVVLGTPTGSGKSIVAQALLFKALVDHRCATRPTDDDAASAADDAADAPEAAETAADRFATPLRAFYTAPIKALVNEKYLDLARILGADNIGMMTGDGSINPDAPIICCTAEILALMALGAEAQETVGYVVMDEFHYFGEYDRGWAWQLPLLTLTRAQFLLMSATLGDTSQIETLIHERTGRQVANVTGFERPVPLSFSYTDIALHGTVELALRDGKAPLYVVHFSQLDALDSAKQLTSVCAPSKERQAKIREICKGCAFNTDFGKELQRLLGFGIGIHHAGMLPRYRLLVERLAQEGLLDVICGTDTLGVGINVPIHTVLLTGLTKYDGHHQRVLRAREFHQIAGRAGRAGFDTSGEVIVEAPEHEIENAKIRAKFANDPAKLRKAHLKSPREGVVTWNKGTFDKLVAQPPERLHPRMKMTHAMVLECAEDGGDIRARLLELVEMSLQTPEEKAQLATRLDSILASLITAGILGRETLDDGTEDYFVLDELPSNFALEQPLSPFLLAALDLLDRESPTYALDLVSMVEAVVPNPNRILDAQQYRERGLAMARMKAEGIEHEEILERIKEVTWPKPLEELLEPAFQIYCEGAPWAAEDELRCKSVVREMLEQGDTFKSFVARYKLTSAEGTFLKYLNEVFRTLDRTVPFSRCTDEVEDIIEGLYGTIRAIDGSIMDDLGALAAGVATQTAAEGELGPAWAEGTGFSAKQIEIMVRNALFLRVQLMARRADAQLGNLDGEWGFGLGEWRRVMDAYFAEHDQIRTDAEAHNTNYFHVDTASERDGFWHVQQLLLDEDGDCDFRIEADLVLAASAKQGRAVFDNYRVWQLGGKADADADADAD